MLIVDDLLATGGTAQAASKLVKIGGGVIVGIAFIIELTALKGRDNLPKGVTIKSLISY